MMEDFVSWNLTKNGILFVQFRYFAEWDHQHGPKLITTNALGKSDINPGWPQLWKLKGSAII
jgi:hypothetical protein